MEKTNKYGYIHGGCSFFSLDTKTHDLAAENIGDCMTSNASIYYHKPISPEDREGIKYDLKIISQTRSTVLVQGQILRDKDVLVTGMFTFVKIKQK